MRRRPFKSTSCDRHLRAKWRQVVGCVVHLKQVERVQGMERSAAASAPALEHPAEPAVLPADPGRSSLPRVSLLPRRSQRTPGGLERTLELGRTAQCISLPGAAYGDRMMQG
jgi:hypothetical protein